VTPSYITGVTCDNAAEGLAYSFFRNGDEEHVASTSPMMVDAMLTNLFVFVGMVMLPDHSPGVMHVCVASTRYIAVGRTAHTHAGARTQPQLTLQYREKLHPYAVDASHTPSAGDGDVAVVAAPVAAPSASGDAPVNLPHVCGRESAGMHELSPNSDDGGHSVLPALASLTEHLRVQKRKPLAHTPDAHWSSESQHSPKAPPLTRPLHSVA
jgi:hypothetical protein